jgi:hypothetical protein
MSAGKLSRIAGSVFVLAAALGGIDAASSGVEHGTGGSDAVKVVKVADAEQVAPSRVLSDIVWV